MLQMPQTFTLRSDPAPALKSSCLSPMFLVLLGSRDTVFFVVHSDWTGICFAAAKELCFCQPSFLGFGTSWLVIFPNYEVMTHLVASPGLKWSQQIGSV